MSSILLKIYSFFIVATLLFSSFFLYTKKIPIYKTSNEVVKENFANNAGVIITPSEKIPSLATSSNTEIPVLKSNQLATTTQQKQNISTQTEIDANEIDQRTSNQKIIPCVNTITYKLGTFDSRFGISKNTFLSTISSSAELWNNAVGKKLFEYNPNGNQNDLTINLIYDGRQQATEDNKLLGTEIENTKNAALTLQTEYESLKITFTEQKDLYTQRLTAFNEKQKIYNDTVTLWNEKGGAPREEYDALTLQKEELQKESDALVLDHDTLVKLLTTINDKITKHNELVNFANQNVNVNNSVAKKKFTEGNYSPSTNSITIYQFSDEIKLKRVLAHELGHALGIMHTKSKDSIMYAVNTATTTELNADDIREIENICTGN